MVLMLILSLFIVIELSIKGMQIVFVGIGQRINAAWRHTARAYIAAILVRRPYWFRRHFDTQSYAVRTRIVIGRVFQSWRSEYRAWTSIESVSGRSREYYAASKRATASFGDNIRSSVASPRRSECRVIRVFDDDYRARVSVGSAE